jgi:ElaB/YqjD/DUF883 family membrane-anchored ribosome-binding protein
MITLEKYRHVSCSMLFYNFADRALKQKRKPSVHHSNYKRRIFEMSQNREGFNPNSPATNTGAGTGSSGSTGTGIGSSGSTGIGSSGIGSGSYGSGSTGTATALSQTAQDYGQKISDAATQAKDYVSDKVSVVGDKLKELQNADIGEVAENAKEYARKNPGQAILISAAAGLVLGLILRGRRQ